MSKTKKEGKWAITCLEPSKSGMDRKTYSELKKAMALQVANGIVGGVVRDLQEIASRVVAPLPSTSFFQWLSELRWAVATKNARGAANFIIVSDIGLTFLMEESKKNGLNLFNDIKIQDGGLDYLKYIGEIQVGQSPMKVFRSDLLGYSVVVGYKGKTPLDTGYVFCPFVPILPSNPTFNVDDYSPCVEVMSKNGKLVMEKDDASDISAPDYYVTFDVPSVVK